MAYPTPFLRLVASGSLFTVEQFSFSMSLIPAFNNDPEGTAPSEVPQDMIDAFETFWLTSTVSASARLEVLKLNLIGEDGRYASDSETVLHDYGSTGIAGGGGNQYPAQVALAVSLRTIRSRGRAHAGRFYLPTPALTIGSDGRVAEATVEIVATRIVELVDAINDSVTGFRVGVASDVGTGRHQPVTGITIGRTLDTIRSRRTSIPEGYVTVQPVA